MTGDVRTIATVVIFTAMIALVVLRPLKSNEAWWTVAGGAAFLALGLVTPKDALDATLEGKNAVLFLLALLALSLLVGKSGFFEWAAIWCARTAKGDARALYRNMFILGAVITATLSLDTTAVILTPVVLALVRRVKLPAAPYVVLCALVANVASLLLPISNLTNLLFAETFHFSFAAFSARMVGPQVAVLGALYAMLRWQFRNDLPARFEAETLPPPTSVVPDRGYFAACVGMLGVALVGYFVAPLAHVEPYVIAFACSVVLAVVGLFRRRVAPAALGELSWGLVPFVVGLFVAVRGLENLHVADVCAEWLSHLPTESPVAMLASASSTSVASNVMNNLPAALLAQRVLAIAHAQPSTVLAALIGADVGPIVVPFGSLATMLVVTLARREGEDVRIRTLVTFGAWAAPVLVLVAVATLVGTFAVVP